MLYFRPFLAQKLVNTLKDTADVRFIAIFEKKEEIALAIYVRRCNIFLVSTHTLTALERERFLPYLGPSFCLALFFVILAGCARQCQWISVAKHTAKRNEQHDNHRNFNAVIPKRPCFPRQTSTRKRK